MKILIIGTTGAIGSKVKESLASRHEVITAGRNSGDVRVDLTNTAAIEQLYKTNPGLDAGVCIADFTFSR
jgi:dTDP-4-dehydrorhamnose reductase